MRNVETKPTISVVVSTRHAPAVTLDCIGSLAAQVAAVGGELLLVVGGTHAPVASAHGVKLHFAPGGSVFDCRALGMNLAEAEIVVLTEDHCAQHPGWAARILGQFARRPDLVLLGGAVENASTIRLIDKMNYWMNFSAFAPGQTTAGHPCLAHYALRKSKLDLPVKVGEMETRVIEKFTRVPGAVVIDPQLCVSHRQSNGLRRTFAGHYHNGRSTGGMSRSRYGRTPSSLRASLWAWTNVRRHLKYSYDALVIGKKSKIIAALYLLAIMPLATAHLCGEYIGGRFGGGASAKQLD